MKKLIGLTLALMLIATFAACTSNDQDTVPTDLSTLHVFTVDINPSILFVINDEEIVVSYVLNNEDAEIVAADLDFVGLTAEAALELFIEAAIEAGYLDVDAENNAIFITTEDDEDDEADQDEEGTPPNLGDRLRNKAEGKFRAHAIRAAVILGTLDETLLELAENYDIGIGRLRILQTAVTIDGELTFEEALEMEMKDLMAIIHESHADRMAEFRTTRQERARNVREEMSEAVRERLEAHRAEREENGAELPDIDAYREAYKARAQELLEQYRMRAQEHREQAENRRPNHGQ